MNQLRVICGLLLGLVLACSGDDGGESAAGSGGTTGGPDASTMSGGTGATSGTGSGGTGTVVMTEPIACGETTCPLPPGQELVDMLATFGLPLPGGGLFTACCTAQDACGLVVMTVGDGGITNSDCVPRPESDSRCPERNLLGTQQPGCCIEETGMCGVNEAQIGGGCTDYSGEVFGALLGFTPEVCEGFDAGLPVGGDEDAGS